jgi:hypothetical protein
MSGQSVLHYKKSKPAPLNPARVRHPISRKYQFLRNCRAGIVYEDIESAENRNCLLDGAPYGFRICGIRLNRDRLSAGAFDFFDDRCGRVCTFRVGYGHLRPVRGQALGDSSSNAERTPCN